MKLPVVFSLIALFVSLNFTAVLGWQHHLEYAGDRYDVLARNLLHNGTYIDLDGKRAYRLPGYPLFLAACFALFDDSEAVVRLFQSVLAACLVFLATVFTWRLTRKHRAVIAAGVVLLISWYMYWAAAYLQTEILFAFLLMLLVIALYHRWYGASGVLTGIALLTRGTFVFAVPFLLLVVFGLNPRGVFGKMLKFTLPMLLIVGVWTLRNTEVLGTFIPFSTGSGQALYGASNPLSFARGDGLWINPPDVPGGSALLAIPNEVDQDRAFTLAATDAIRQTPPGVVAWSMITRALNLLTGWHNWEAATWSVRLVIGIAAVSLLLSLRLSRGRS